MGNQQGGNPQKYNRQGRIIFIFRNWESRNQPSKGSRKPFQVNSSGILQASCKQWKHLQKQV